MTSTPRCVLALVPCCQINDRKVVKEGSSFGESTLAKFVPLAQEDEVLLKVLEIDLDVTEYIRSGGLGSVRIRTDKQRTTKQEMLSLIVLLQFVRSASPGGGGGTWVFRGRIRSLSKLENTPKALISGPKSTIILIKMLTFSTK